MMTLIFGIRGIGVFFSAFLRADGAFFVVGLFFAAMRVRPAFAVVFDSAFADAFVWMIVGTAIRATCGGAATGGVPFGAPTIGLVAAAAPATAAAADAGAGAGASAGADAAGAALAGCAAGATTEPADTDVVAGAGGTPCCVPFVLPNSPATKGLAMQS